MIRKILAGAVITASAAGSVAAGAAVAATSAPAVVASAPHAQPAFLYRG